MSYIVSIRRPDGPPISSEEVRSLIHREPDLEIEESDASEEEVVFYWLEDPSNRRFAFCLTDGAIDSTTTPPNAVLSRMQQLATQLDARLIGEQGEDLSDLEVPAVELSGGLIWGCVVLLLAILAGFAWWLV